MCTWRSLDVRTYVHTKMSLHNNTVEPAQYVYTTYIRTYIHMYIRTYVHMYIGLSWTCQHYRLSVLTHFSLTYVYMYAYTEVVGRNLCYKAFSGNSTLLQFPQLCTTAKPFIDTEVVSEKGYSRACYILRTYIRSCSCSWMHQHCSILSVLTLY